MAQQFLKLKLNAPLRGNAAGATLRVKSTGGVPNDKYWRSRLTDAETDKCVEVVQKPRAKPPEGGSKK